MKKRRFILLLLLYAIFSNLFAQVRYESETQKLGTQFKLIFYCQDTLTAAEYASEAWQLVDSLNMIFSDYEALSEVTLLSESSGSDQWITVSDPLWEVITVAQHISKLSEGGFDVTIGPLSKLWRRAIRRNVLPEERDISQAKAHVRYQWIHLDKDKQAILLEKENMRLDLGGIAKGYIIDHVYQLFADRGINEVLVDGGGDIYVGATPDSNNPWQLSYGKEGKIAHKLEYTAIASSGNQYRYLESDGIKYSHIIDPRTGYGTMQPSEVVISAPTCMLADALASAISIMGLEQGEQLLRHFPKSKIAYLERHKL